MSVRRAIRAAGATALFLIPGRIVRAAGRFPQPEFDVPHKPPPVAWPDPRLQALEWLDVATLVLTLALAVWLAHRRRSRRGLMWLGLFCLAYFGFIREGCVCSVGAIQNVAEAFANPGVALPLSVVVFFVLPLFVTLFFGRVFCAAVCPLGAIQDVVGVRPQRISRHLEAALSLIPYAYLGLAVLLAATRTSYIICRFDPFVGFFRLSGPVHMMVLGGMFLLGGVFLARPYCRFFCPYGVLLGWLSHLSRRRITVTPDICVQCRLCEEACPYDAIEKPAPERPEPVRVGVRRLVLLTAAVPLMLVGGWFLGSRLGPGLARFHRETVLAEQLLREELGQGEATVETLAYRSSGEDPAELRARVDALRLRLGRGGSALGLFFGLVLSWRLVGRSMRRHNVDYEPDPGRCLACGRCYKSCPRERIREANREGSLNAG